MTDDRAQIEAINWRLHMPTMDEDGWAAFTEWLESNPGNAHAYDAVASLDATLPEMLRRVDEERAPEADPADRTTVSGRKRFWALAAAIMLMIGSGIGYRFVPRASVDYLLVSQPGMVRQVRLAEGTLVTLNGDTRLILSKREPRLVRVEQGEVAFRVAHDDARPFRVTAGPVTVQDVGTFFNVSRLAGGVEISVGEGSVSYDPDGSNILLHAGQTAFVAQQPAALEIREVDPTAVASWRSRKLVYRVAPVSRVAADVGRIIGRRMELDPNLAGQTFSGVLLIEGSDDVVRRRIQGLLGIDIVADEAVWRLRPQSRASR